MKLSHHKVAYSFNGSWGIAIVLNRHQDSFNIFYSIQFQLLCYKWALSWTTRNNTTKHVV